MIECRGGDGPACLTAAQVKAASKIYDRAGEDVLTGFKPGSELGWAQLAGGPRPFRVGDDLFKYVVFKDAEWDFKTFDPARDLALANRVDNNLLNATDPNLKPFTSRGGKLLVYHGWADQVLGPQYSVDYDNQAVAAVGPEQAASSIRLFMAPGMAHCNGGVGPSSFDALAALEQWVEQGRAPAQIVASRLTDGKVDRTRPLCPYPQVAQYKGTGSTDEAQNWVCGAPGTR